jgi:flagellar biosynthesis protein FlhG
MVTILPIASGKGGVGKSILSSNLGIALARAGKTVVLVDLDLGGANLHTCLGIRNNNAGIGNLIYKQESNLESLLVETEERRLHFIPGDSLLPGTANLPYYQKLRLLKGLNSLVADYVILDLGSGSSYNTVDFFLTTSDGLMVVIPETTAILNAYSFLKTALYRLLFRSFPRKSRERQFVSEFVSQRLEGGAESFRRLVDGLARIGPESGERAAAHLDAFKPRIVMNMGRADQDIQVGSKLKAIVEKNLDVETQYVGYLPTNPLVPESILRRRPVISSHPNCDFSQSVHRLAERIIQTRLPGFWKLFEADDELAELKEESMAQGLAQGQI